MGGDDQPEQAPTSSTGTSRAHVLRGCLRGEHDGVRSGHLPACFVAVVGIILTLAGVLGLLTHMPAVWPDRMEMVLEGNTGFFTAFGILLIGFSVLGRKQLVDRLINVGKAIKQELL